jgi:hypothetical protein
MQKICEMNASTDNIITFFVSYLGIRCLWRLMLFIPGFPGEQPDDPSSSSLIFPLPNQRRSLETREKEPCMRDAVTAAAAAAAAAETQQVVSKDIAV